LDLRIEARPAPLVGRSTRSNPLRAAHPRRGSPTSCGGPIPTAANMSTPKPPPTSWIGDAVGIYRLVL